MPSRSLLAATCVLALTAMSGLACNKVMQQAQADARQGLVAEQVRALVLRQQHVFMENMAYAGTPDARFRGSAATHDGEVVFRIDVDCSGETLPRDALCALGVDGLGFGPKRDLFHGQLSVRAGGADDPKPPFIQRKGSWFVVEARFYPHSDAERCLLMRATSEAHEPTTIGETLCD